MGADLTQTFKAVASQSPLALVIAGVGQYASYLHNTYNIYTSVAFQVVAHSAIGGAYSELAGGDFASGALASGVSTLAGVTLYGDGIGYGKVSNLFGATGFAGVALRTASAAVVKGTISSIGGGKFANGAITAAFVHLYNQEAHRDDHRFAEYVRSVEREYLIKRVLGGMKAYYEHGMEFGGFWRDGDRYVFTREFGWIDFQHVSAAAVETIKCGPQFALNEGIAMEGLQTIASPFSGRACQSFMRTEDVVSNLVGVMFAQARDFPTDLHFVDLPTARTIAPNFVPTQDQYPWWPRSR